MFHAFHDLRVAAKPASVMVGKLPPGSDDFFYFLQAWLLKKLVWTVLARNSWIHAFQGIIAKMRLYAYKKELLILRLLLWCSL